MIKLITHTITAANNNIHRRVRSLQIQRRERNYAIMDVLSFKHPPDDETAAFRVQHLVNEGHKVTAFENMFQKTTLFVAVKNNWPETCRTILQNCDNSRFPYWENREGLNALLCTVPMHHSLLTAETPALEAAKVLVEEFKVDPRVQNCYGQTPAHCAQSYEARELAKYFRTQEIRFNQEDIPLPDWYQAK